MSKNQKKNPFAAERAALDDARANVGRINGHMDELRAKRDTAVRQRDEKSREIAAADAAHREALAGAALIGATAPAAPDTLPLAQTQAALEAEIGVIDEALRRLAAELVGAEAAVVAADRELVRVVREAKREALERKVLEVAEAVRDCVLADMLDGADRHKLSSCMPRNLGHGATSCVPRGIEAEHAFVEAHGGRYTVHLGRLAQRSGILEALPAFREEITGVVAPPPPPAPARTTEPAGVPLPDGWTTDRRDVERAERRLQNGVMEASTFS